MRLNIDYDHVLVLLAEPGVAGTGGSPSVYRTVLLQ